MVKVVGLGEPVLHPQFDLLMDQLTEHRITSVVYTNGELFKKFSPDRIAPWRVQTVVTSVDGLDADSFARIRVGGDYLQIKQSLAAFYRVRAKLGGRRPELEIRHVIFPNETPSDLLRFRQEWLKICVTVKFNYLYFPTPPSGEVRNIKCRDIRRELYIHWNGRVPLCGYQYLSSGSESLGDIRKMTIAELWMQTRLPQVRSYHDRRNLDPVPFCKACTFK